jgi:hypothetical protein
MMLAADLFSEEFAQAAATAGLRAREQAPAAGHSVVYIDDVGRYVQELPDVRLLEVCLHPGNPRESHI